MTENSFYQIMKKNIRFILLVSFCLILAGCSIYEDVYFNEDGTVAYSLQVDASEVMAMTPSGKNTYAGIGKDTIISFAEVINKHKDSLAVLSDEQRDLVESLYPLIMKVESDTIDKKLVMSISGEFKNAEALNKAFISMNEMDDFLNKNKMDENKHIRQLPKFQFHSQYQWNGKTMTHSLLDEKVNNKKGEEEEDNQTNERDGLLMLFTGGKMSIRYHFPSRIKSVDKENALFSQDGKTLVMEYPSSMFIKPDADKLQIEIEVE